MSAQRTGDDYNSDSDSRSDYSGSESDTGSYSSYGSSSYTGSSFSGSYTGSSYSGSYTGSSYSGTGSGSGSDSDDSKMSEPELGRAPRHLMPESLMTEGRMRSGSAPPPHSEGQNVSPSAARLRVEEEELIEESSEEEEEFDEDSDASLEWSDSASDTSNDEDVFGDVDDEQVDEGEWSSGPPLLDVIKRFGLYYGPVNDPPQENVRDMLKRFQLVVFDPDRVECDVSQIYPAPSYRSKAIILARYTFWPELKMKILKPQPKKWWQFWKLESSGVDEAVQNMVADVRRLVAMGYNGVLLSGYGAACRKFGEEFSREVLLGATKILKMPSVVSPDEAVVVKPKNRNKFEGMESDSDEDTSNEHASAGKGKGGDKGNDGDHDHDVELDEFGNEITQQVKIGFPDSATALIVLDEPNPEVWGEFSKECHGIMVRNVTMNDHGKPKLFFGEDWQCMNDALFDLSRVTQERNDFCVMMMECVSSIDDLRPELVHRFRVFCEERAFAGGMSTDGIEHLQVPEANPMTAGLGPLGLLNDDVVVNFETDVRDADLFKNPGWATRKMTSAKEKLPRRPKITLKSAERAPVQEISAALAYLESAFCEALDGVEWPREEGRDKKRRKKRQRRKKKGKTRFRKAEDDLVGGKPGNYMSSPVLFASWIQFVADAFSRSTARGTRVSHSIAGAAPILDALAQLSMTGKISTALDDLDGSSDDDSDFDDNEIDNDEVDDDEEEEVIKSKPVASSAMGTGLTPGMGEEKEEIDGDGEGKDKEKDETPEEKEAREKKQKDFQDKQRKVVDSFHSLNRYLQSSHANRDKRAGVGKLTGQREFGYLHTPEDFKQVVFMQRELRHAELLADLSLPTRREVYKGHDHSNPLEVIQDKKYTDALKSLENILRGHSHNKRIMEAFVADNEIDDHNNSVYRTIRNLIHDLQTPYPDSNFMKVHLWESDPAGLTSTRYKRGITSSKTLTVRYKAVSEVEDGVLHIYISKAHPNPTEALLHQYFQYKGLNHTAACLVEGLARTPPKKVKDVVELDLDEEGALIRQSVTAYPGPEKTKKQKTSVSILSDRIVHQIKNSSTSELLGFVQRTRKTRQKLMFRDDLETKQVTLSLVLARQIQDCAKEQLLETHEDPVELLQAPRLTPSLGLPYTIAMLIRDAAWNPDQFDHLRLILLVLKNGMKIGGARDPASQLVADVIASAGREYGIAQLELGIRDVNPYIIREPDLCTVYIEMGGHSEDAVRRMFNMGKFDLGKLIYKRIRLAMVTDEKRKAEVQRDGAAVVKHNAYTKHPLVVLSYREYGKRFLDGLFFMLPLLINLILVLTMGIGLFTSTYMARSQQAVAGMAVMFAFCWIGGLNAFVAKTGSYYRFQWSFAVMEVVLSRLIWAGIMISLVCALLIGAIIKITYSWEDTMMFVYYSFMFAMLQLMMAALFNAHSGSIWVSSEGKAIIASMGCALLTVMVLQFGVQLEAVFTHALSLLVSVLWLFCSYIYLMYQHTSSTEGVKPTKDTDVLEWYQSQGGPPPPPRMTKSADQDAALIEWQRMEEGVPEGHPMLAHRSYLLRARKRVIRQTREARREFSKAVADAGRIAREDDGSGRAQRLLFAVHPMVRHRAKMYESEESLVHWYVLLSGKSRPEPASGKWDEMLGEAITSMDVKRKTDLPHRGGVLWDRVSSYVAHGSFYFALMFVDRFVRLAATSVPFFVPTSAYELAIGWAQVFLLLAVGSLEPVIHRRETALNNAQHIRIPEDGQINLEKLLTSRDRLAVGVYFGELRNVLFFSVLSFAASCGMYLLFSQTIEIEGIIIFLVGVLGLTGFLIGGFNMLFLTGQQHIATRAIIASFVIGILGAAGVMTATLFSNLDFASIGLPKLSWEDTSVFALVFGGFAYMVLSNPKMHEEDPYDVYSRAPLMSTAMQTSGQKWMRTQKYNQFQLDDLCIALEDCEDAIRTSPNTKEGRQATELMRQANLRHGRLDREDLMLKAFPQASAQLAEILAQWNTGTMQVFLIPREYLCLPGKKGEDPNPFSAVSRKDEYGRLYVYVGYDPTNPRELPRILAEAIIHEGFEGFFNMSHGYAVVSELLVHPPQEPELYVGVPLRLMKEMEATPDALLGSIIDGTDEQLLHYVMMNVSEEVMDRQWNTIEYSTKLLILGLAEGIDPNKWSKPLSDEKLRLLTGLSRRQFERSVGELTGDMVGPMWEQRLALAQLQCRVCWAIKHEARRIIQQRADREAMYSPVDFDPLQDPEWDPYTVLEEEVTLNLDVEYSHGRQCCPDNGFCGMCKRESEDTLLANVRVSKMEDYLQTFDTVARLFIMALTGDISFPIDLQAARKMGKQGRDGGIGLRTYIIFRLLVSPIYWITLRGISVLIWLPARLFNPEVKALERTVDKGLFKTFVMGRGGRVISIERNDPEDMKTGFVEYDMDGDVDHVDVYPGILKKRPNSDPVLRHEYVCGHLSRTLALKGGKVMHSAIYGYTEDEESMEILATVTEDDDFGMQVPDADQDTRPLPAGMSTRKTTLKKSVRAWNVDPLPTARRVYQGEVLNEMGADPKRRESVTWYDSQGRPTRAVLWRKKPTNLVQGTGAHILDLEGTGGSEPQIIEVETIYTYIRGHPADSRVRSALHSCSAFGDMRVDYIDHSTHVSEVRHREGDEEEVVSRYVYRHILHPVVTTIAIDLASGKERASETPLIVSDDPYKLVKVPPPRSIYDDDYLVKLPSQRRGISWARRFFNVFGAFLPKQVPIYTKGYSERQGRLTLWAIWTSGKLEGVFAQMWDEDLLRRSPILKPYWRYRDWCFVDSARNYILEKQDLITPAISFPSTSHIILRVADLLDFVPGGMSNSNERRDVAAALAGEAASVIESSVPPSLITRDRPLMVTGLDSGTWPADGGGVASCRRDVINRLPRIRWQMIAEIGSRMKLVQRAYQIERNVSSLTFLPLWGVEVGGPNQSVLSNVPYSLLAARAWRTTDAAIRKYFVPLVTRLAVASTIINPSYEDLDDFTALFVNLYQYFQRFDWSVTWDHPLVRGAWRRAWLGIETSRATALRREGRTDQILASELPAVDEIDVGLNLFIHFLMPLTVPLPYATVVHSTHHGVQSVLGAVAHRLRKAGFVIWDHGILWRERLIAISELYIFPLFVRNCLLGLTRLAVAVNFHNADLVVPCASVSNPDWEARLGGHGVNQQTIAMWRRISPVINGMETDRFHIAHDNEAPDPTAVMLSHVYDLKDVKNAIRAADIIVNQFEMGSYRLLIYGGLDKDLDYTDECRAIISERSLENNVFLMGLGNAPLVLPQGWVFVNSSKSEGLPLALGEAGLAGLPVVCTDVGASSQVISKNNDTFGALVPARDSQALARGQLRVMAMLGKLEALGSSRRDQDVRRGLKALDLDDFHPLMPGGPNLEERMREMVAHRHRLAMQLRAYVLGSFTMERYLREHEQTIWIASMRCRERVVPEDVLAEREEVERAKAQAIAAPDAAHAHAAAAATVAAAAGAPTILVQPESAGPVPEMDANASGGRGTRMAHGSFAGAGGQLRGPSQMGRPRSGSVMGTEMMFKRPGSRQVSAVSEDPEGRTTRSGSLAVQVAADQQYGNRRRASIAPGERVGSSTARRAPSSVQRTATPSIRTPSRVATPGGPAGTAGAAKTPGSGGSVPAHVRPGTRQRALSYSGGGAGSRPGIVTASQVGGAGAGAGVGTGRFTPMGEAPGAAASIRRAAPQFPGLKPP